MNIRIRLTINNRSSLMRSAVCLILQYSHLGCILNPIYHFCQYSAIQMSGCYVSCSADCSKERTLSSRVSAADREKEVSREIRNDSYRHGIY